MKRFIIALALIFSCVALPAASAVAYDPLNEACQVGGNNSGSSAVCTDKNKTADPVSGPNGILYKVTRIVANVAGIAAVIMVLLSGFYFITANGEASKVASAKSALIGAVVGVVIVLTAQAILKFVLSKV